MVITGVNKNAGKIDSNKDKMNTFDIQPDDRCVIPEGTTEIGEGAFDGCTGLTSIIVSEDNPKYYSNGNCLLTKEKK